VPSPAHVSIVKLRKWFPPHDPLAAKIARLCILREDLLVEMQGVHTEDIKELDGHSPQFRRMYFLRSLLRTQMELSSAIQTLLGNLDFKALLEKQSDEVKTKFAEAAALIGKAHSVLKDIRNEIGGHVQESGVQAALERIEANTPNAFGLLDLGPRANLTHYKFAGELTAEILLKDVSEEERRNIQSGKFALLADLLPTFTLIEHCLIMYAEDRGLLPRLLDAEEQYGPFVASTMSNRFHKPNCKWARRIRSRSRTKYSSHAEAVEAGKKPCVTCRA